MAITSSPAQKHKSSRSKDPGVRLVGGRIYDSQNGKTCHQCRQKTRDFAASCMNLKGNKQCTMKFCHKCLLNRYGEKAEEVALLDAWECPKCRGICNCSFCMKKRGHKPTGILVHTAKENGFSSVSELLHVKGPENFGHDKTDKDMGVSPKKRASSKEPIGASPRKAGKENSFDGNSTLNLPSKNGTLISSGKKSRKLKSEGLKEISHGKREGDANLKESNRKKPRITEEVSKKETKTNVEESNRKKPRITDEVSKKETKTNVKDKCISLEEWKPQIQSSEFLKKTVEINGKVSGNFVEKKKFKTQVLKENSCTIGNAERDATDCNGAKVANGVSNKARIQSDGTSNGIKSSELATKARTAAELCKMNRCKAAYQNKLNDADIRLPVGSCLTTVASTELPPEDVGEALQFLEFCAAFGKVLDLKKGQAEAVIREIVNGRRGRRSCNSLSAEIHIKILSLIQKDIGEVSPALSPTNGKNSWLKALGKHLSNNPSILKEFHWDCFDMDNEGYAQLNSSKKLKLLNILCDEALNTKELRNWIEDEKSKFLEREKEAKEKVLAAKEKEKNLKQKMQDEMARAVMANNSASFSVSEYEAIVSRIKIEAAQAHKEMLEAMGMVPKQKQRSDAVRTDPILLDVNGHAFWRLKGYNGQPNVLLQDMGTWKSVSPDEKWFVYDSDQEKEIEKYISSLRTKRLRAEKFPEPLSIGDVEEHSLL